MANDVVAEGAPVEGAEEPKKGLIGKLLGNKKMLIIGGAALLLLLGGGGAAYYFFFAGSDTPTPEEQMAEADNTPIVPPTVAFYEVPDIIVNIQTVDGSPAYLKLGISLELANDAQKAGLQVVMPRVVDQFQGYLRELRMDDLKGSAGVLRLKEELLRRINAAAAPYRIRDVLLKEMIVQ